MWSHVKPRVSGWRQAGIEGRRCSRRAAPARPGSANHRGGTTGRVRRRLARCANRARARGDGGTRRSTPGCRDRSGRRVTTRRCGARWRRRWSRILGSGSRGRDDAAVGASQPTALAVVRPNPTASPAAFSATTCTRASQARRCSASGGMTAPCSVSALRRPSSASSERVDHHRGAVGIGIGGDALRAQRHERVGSPRLDVGRVVLGRHDRDLVDRSRQGRGHDGALRRGHRRLEPEPTPAVFVPVAEGAVALELDRLVGGGANLDVGTPADRGAGGVGGPPDELALTLGRGEPAELDDLVDAEHATLERAGHRWAGRSGRSRPSPSDRPSTTTGRSGSRPSAAGLGRLNLARPHDDRSRR